MPPKSGKEEYHHPEEALEADYPEEGTSEDVPEVGFDRTFSFKTLLLSKKVWVPFAIIVAIYALYWFMDIRDKRHQTVADQEVASQVQVEQPVRQPPPITAALPRQPTVLNDELKTAVEQSNRNQAQLETLTNELDQIQAVQSQMNSELAGLHDAIQNLTQKIGALATRKTAKKRVRRRLAKPAPRYHIKALVPGRAWLQTGRGKTFTIKVGERIRGYGVVKWIDVTKGIVGTSSGREITYGKYDS